MIFFVDEHLKGRKKASGVSWRISCPSFFFHGLDDKEEYAPLPYSAVDLQCYFLCSYQSSNDLLQISKYPVDYFVKSVSLSHRKVQYLC